jgi:spore maturation protein CgeB
MRIVIFGLSVTSAWGNGHATLWRGLIRALTRSGHTVQFFERDQPFYAPHRDPFAVAGAQVILYEDWDDIRSLARRSVAEADVIIITSFCPDARAADRLTRLYSHGLHVFYDLDSPVTLAQLGDGIYPDYLPIDGLAHAHLVLSYAGGRALDALSTELGARLVLPLYGHVDPDEHKPIHGRPPFTAALSYLGTYSQDRQSALQRLFLDTARKRPGQRFLLAGAQYPDTMETPANVQRVEHVPPARHASFFAGSKFTLNITRRPMAEVGYCPQGRLFEAAACGAAILSDRWEGIETFLEPGREILLVETTDDVEAALDMSDLEARHIGQEARQRVLQDHSSTRRVRELEGALEQANNLRRMAMPVAVLVG